MCGIFGFVSKAGARPSMETLARIATVTEQRGPHAFGFSWIDAEGRLRAFKQAGPISDSLDLLTMVRNARLLIGHTRYATQGAPEANVNNHPHPVDGGWLVHNGMIRQYAELVEQYDFHPVSECDSEVLALLIEELPGNLVQRCKDAVRRAGDGPLAMAALWKSPQRLVAIRDGNPLALGEDAAGWYFGSLERGIPSARSLPDGCVLSWSRQGKIATLTRSTLGAEVERKQTHQPARVTRPRYQLW